MVKIMLKLKKKSQRDFLTTPSGFTVNKEWSEVDDKDPTIQGYLHYRNDIDIKEVSKVIKDSPVSTEKETFVEKKTTKEKDDKSSDKRD